MYLDDMLESKADQFRNRGLVTDNLRDVQQSGFECRRTAGDEGCCGVGEKLVGLRLHHLCLAVT